MAMSNLSVECNTTERYLSYVACLVGLVSSILVILIVVSGKHYKKTFHRFFLYYSIAAALLSAFELTKNITEHLTCTHTLPAIPKLYQAYVFFTCYFSGGQLLLLCWVSAYLLLVGVFQWVRLRGWKSEVAAMAVVLLLPTACAWKPIYLVVTPAQQTYGCGLSVTNATYALLINYVFILAGEFLLCLFIAMMALVTFAELVRGTCNKAGPYHSDYAKSLKALLPVIVLLLFASTFGLALSLFVALKEECPVTVEVMQDLIPLSFVSIPVCYVALVYRARNTQEKKSMP